MMKNEYGFNFDNTYLNLSNIFYTKQNPDIVSKPKVLKFNNNLAQELNLDINSLNSELGAQILSGNKIALGSEPIAEAYAGCQFGHFAMLGDGRAILLGEHINNKEDRYDIALKGSGKTPYSRGGDGKASLGPMLREYIISEAMHSLGIPTTRSLAVVLTGDKVYRETPLDGAILTRVAKSHIRVGTIQYAARFTEDYNLQEFVDYTINREFDESEYKDAENKYIFFLKKVIERQASLIAKWQLIGFIHGVMNTDNMTISGETIDYGPCAFMDTYNVRTVFSSIDYAGRYAYGNQPSIGLWNLARLAESLIDLISDDSDEAIKILEPILLEYNVLYKKFYIEGMAKKLGIVDEVTQEDEKLIDSLLALMQEFKADYTNTFVDLTKGIFEGQDLYDNNKFKIWKSKWEERLKGQGKSIDEIKKIMMENNPIVIPRNHKVEEALTAAQNGDLCYFNDLLTILSDPFNYSKENEFKEYMSLPEDEGVPYRTYCGT
ncbi:MAG: protein adenylyltransferase SelO [Sarcina sp.]